MNTADDAFTSAYISDSGGIIKFYFGKTSIEKYFRMEDNAEYKSEYMDSLGDLIFTGANPAADAILGVDNRQFIGKPIERAFPSLVKIDAPYRYRRVCILGDPWRTEQITYEQGEIKRAFEVTAFRFDCCKKIRKSAKRE
ncbi:MAG: hypothetical protein GY859_21410 [Desulfobacterales bacterium]|nr:hypothetical protein [Desulfobacterales bacterium]